MASVCPHCHQLTLISSDIEAIANAVLLTKIQNRTQQCCQNCGWFEVKQDAPDQFFVSTDKSVS